MDGWSVLLLKSLVVSLAESSAVPSNFWPILFPTGKQSLNPRQIDKLPTASTLLLFPLINKKSLNASNSVGLSFKLNVLKKFKVPMGLNDSKQSKEGWRLSCKESLTSDDTTIKCPLHKLGDGFESIDSILHRNWEIDLWIVTYPEKRFKVFDSLEKLAIFLVENPQNEDVYYTDYWKEENKIFAKWRKEIKRKVKEFLDENREVLLKLGATSVSSWDQYIEIFKDKECFIIDPSSGKVETHIKFIYDGEPVQLQDFNQDIKKWLVSRVEELLD